MIDGQTTGLGMRTYGPRNRREEMSAIAFGLALCAAAVSFGGSFITLEMLGLDRGYISLFSRGRSHEWEVFALGASFLVSMFVAVLTYRGGKKLLLKPNER